MSPRRRTGDCEPVGMVEIAERLGVKQQTVAMWKYRGLLPEPRWTVSKLPAWDWPDILEWAQQREAHKARRTKRS